MPCGYRLSNASQERIARCVVLRVRDTVRGFRSDVFIYAAFYDSHTT